MARHKPRVQGGVQPAAPAESTLRFLALPAGVAALAVAAYAPTLSAGWTSTDDTELVVEDAAFLQSDGAVSAAFGRPFFSSPAHRSYYRPLVTASFALDAPRGEAPSPAPYHRTNVILHAATSAMVFFVAAAVGATPIVAACSAVLFAVHPMTVQSVAWIPGRCDGLMALSSLGALLAWISFDSKGSWRALLLHECLLAAALFSKEAAIAIPFVALAYTLAVTRRREVLRNPWPWVGWAAVGAAWFFARRHAVGPLDPATAGNALRNSAAVVIGFGKLLVPVELDVLATLRDSSIVPGVAAAALLSLAALTIDDRRRRLFLWAAAVAPLAVLVPALGVSGFLILDNRLYLPAALVAVGAGILAESWRERSRRVAALLLPAWALVAVALVIATVTHAESFESARAFCEAAVRGSPHLGLARLNLGTVEYRDGNLDAAKRDFERALEENPSEPIAHNDLGLVYLNTGDLERAEAEFRTELRANPSYSKAHYNLGLVLARTGRADLAKDEFERVVALAPRDVDAWGELLKYWGPRDDARAEAIEKKMETLGVQFFSP